MDEGFKLAELPKVVAENARTIDWRGLTGLRMLGFALARAWVYLMFLGAASSAATWNGELVPGSAYTISTAALILTVMGAALLEERFCLVVHRAGVRYLGPALTCVGTLLLASSTLAGAPQMLLCVLGGVTTGLGSGLIDMGYGEVYRNVPSRQTCLEAPLAFLLAAVVFYLVGRFPSPVLCGAVSLMPVVAGLILFGHLKVWAPGTLPTVRPVPILASRFAVRIGICACLVGLADGVVRAAFMTTSNTSLEDFYHTPLVWASVITVAIIWGCVLCSRTFNLRSVYKLAVIIMAFFFQLLPVVVGLYAQNVLALAGYGTFNVLIWILLADVAYTYRLSSITVFGIGWGMITVGVLLGSIAGAMLCDAFAPFSPQMLSLVALCATLMVLLSYMFILRESDMLELTRLGEQKELQRSPEADVQTPEGTADTPQPPRFVNRCKQVAAEYGLTERETEVMILYAKGRSYARLQEELHSSRGTITTHLRHIYQKMGVQNKQEFLDLIEGVGHKQEPRGKPPTGASF